MLEALAEQTVPINEFEVVVVSDGSTDGTDDHLAAGRAPLPVVHLSQANQGPAAARNNGIEAAGGDLVLFIDDDVVADRGCVAAHLRRHDEAEEPTVVIGPLLTPLDTDLEPWVAWEQDKLYAQYRAMARGDWGATARQFYTGNASLPRDLLQSAGGFDPSFRRAEDVELAYRLASRGVSFVFDLEARAFHHARRSYDSWLSIADAYGRNDVAMWDRGVEWLVPTLLEEYSNRNVLTRLYTAIGLRAPTLGRLGEQFAPSVAQRLTDARLDRPAHQVLSLVYGLAYARGLSEELDKLGERSAARVPHRMGRRRPDH